MSTVLGPQLSRLRSSAGDSAIYFSTVVAAQVASLVLLPILTRYLGPEAFGQYSLALAVTGLLGALGSTWVRNVGMRLYFDHVADGRTRAFFWTASVLQAVSMGGVLLLAYPFVRLAGSAIPVALYGWAGASVMVTDFYSMGLNTLRAGHRPLSFGLAEWTNSIVRLAITWGVLALGFRSATMLFACVTFSMVLASFVALRGLGQVLVGPMDVDRGMARELVVLGVQSIPSSFSGWLISLSDRLLIAYFLDVRAVGIYSAAYGVADRAVNGLASGLYMSTGPAILRSWAEAGERAAGTISSYLALYVAVTLGPCVLLIQQRDFVLQVLTGSAFASAGAVVPWVVAGVWLAGVATYLNRPLELTKRFGMYSVISTVGAALNVAINVVLIPAFGVAGAAAGTFGALLGFTALSHYVGRRALVVPIPWRSIGWTTGATVLASGASMLVRVPWMAIGVFGVVYAACVGAAWLHQEANSART